VEQTAIDTLPGGAVRVRNPEVGAWDSASAWRAELQTRIGLIDGADPYVFGEVVAFTTDAAGRIYVLDRQANELRVFGPDGAHLRTLGGDGEGPGEFRNPIGMEWSPDSRLWVADPSNDRYTAFDTAGQLIATHRREIGGWGLPWKGAFDRAGRLYESTSVRDPAGEPKGVYIRHAVDDRVVPLDTFPLPTPTEQGLEEKLAPFHIETTVGNNYMQVPYAPKMVWSFDGRDGIWSAVNDHYRLSLQNLPGDTLRVVEKRSRPVPVTPAERADAEKRVSNWAKPGFNQGSRISDPPDLSRIPRFKPAFQELIVDDRGYLWVMQTAHGDGAGTALDVLDPSGRYLGTLNLDLELAAFPPPRIVGDRLLGVVRDELDVPTVVVYRLSGRP
jgi:sugar lactone lactonase YvrE